MPHDRVRLEPGRALPRDDRAPTEHVPRPRGCDRLPRECGHLRLCCDRLPPADDRLPLREPAPLGLMTHRSNHLAYWRFRLVSRPSGLACWPPDHAPLRRSLVTPKFADERETVRLGGASNAPDARCPCRGRVDRLPGSIPDRWLPDRRLRRVGRCLKKSGLGRRQSGLGQRPFGHALKRSDLDQRRSGRGLRRSGRWLRPPDRALKPPRHWSAPLGRALQGDGARRIPPTQKGRQCCRVQRRTDPSVDLRLPACPHCRARAYL
jgi:hypothetical protein